MTLRVVVLGGTGNFGARIVRALQRDTQMEVIAAARRAVPVPGAEGVRVATLDMASADFSDRLRELAPGLVIHCVGPFQKQSYAVVEAAIRVRAHYLDLADGRPFVVQFASANRAWAESAGRVAITGASTLPAVSSAVLEVLTEGLRKVDTVEIAIAPGQRAVRGAATLAAVFSYLGRPSPVWRNGAWTKGFGWMDLRRVPLDVGRRWGAMCDVPDLTLIPARMPGVQSVTFHAALEFRLQHLVLWKLAALRRMGLPFAVDRWAVRLDALSGLFTPFAGEWGGMRVSVVGENAAGQRRRRTWQLCVPAENGPEIPTFPAILLAQRLARGEAMRPGAYPCVGLVRLAEFAALFDNWGVRTRIEEGAVA